MQNVLVTGGAGYIGTHLVMSLLERGMNVTVLDSLCNSSADLLFTVEELAGKSINFIKGDVCDEKVLANIFSRHAITSVFHLAGLKSVSESFTNPLKYYDTNVTGTNALLTAMSRAGVFNFIFSSSATVYGDVRELPISESVAVGTPLNPYGRTKLIVEQMLQDLVNCDPRWSVGVLRYFNPVGAHPSGMIGENPLALPSNLVPFLARVAAGKLPELTIFGTDYPTVDGTGVRDYVHVVDLVDGHICAMTEIRTLKGLNIWNLGTGRGYSVKEVVAAFEKTSGKKIPTKFASRRIGDIAASVTDPRKAQNELRWKARRGLDQMLEDEWRWQLRINAERDWRK